MLKLRQPSQQESLGLKLFLFSSTWAAFVSLGSVGLSPGRYSWDADGATAIARHYLYRPDPFSPLLDMYTQGFVHPLIYVPILWLLRLIGVPYWAHDGIAIGLIYSLSIGLITLFAYLIAATSLSRPAASVIAVAASGSLLLLSQGLDFVTPNGELLGSVLLLIYAYLRLLAARTTQPGGRAPHLNACRWSPYCSAS